MKCIVDIIESEECNNCGNCFKPDERLDAVIDFEDVMMKHPIIAFMHETCPKIIGENSEECPKCKMPNKLHSTRCNFCNANFKTTCNNCGETINRWFAGLAEMNCNGTGHKDKT